MSSMCNRKCNILQLFILTCINIRMPVGGSELWHSENFALGFQFFDQLDLLSSLKNVTTECSTQLRTVANALETNEIWALRMLDAWAKFPSGILYGHRMEMGNFEECLDINSPLIGKYCQANIPFNSAAIGLSVQLQLGVCIPNRCSPNDFDLLLKEALENSYNFSFNATTNLLIASTCSTGELVELEPLDWVAIGLFVLLAALMTLSTLYDCLWTYQRKLPNKLMISFSATKNLRQLLKVQHGHIPCLHGIRCLSLFWIIFLHCYLYRILSPNINSVDIQSWEHTPFSMIEQSGSIAVDSFFFLSGLLVIMVAFREMEKNTGKLNVPMMYIHRYLRLTPVLAVAVLFYMSLFNYIGSGPIWKSFTVANEMCDKTWWATILYVQNYAAPGEMCLGHAWYLAVDTQLFFLSPIFLILIWKWRKIGIAATIALGLLLVACLFTIIIINQYTIYDIARNYGVNSEAMPKIYYSTHTRCSAWIVGLIFGYYLHRNNGRIAKIPKWLVAVGWLISLATIFTLVFAWYPKTLPSTGGPTVLESAFYLAFGRMAWPLAICWVVYACVNGYGGIINSFLSWTFWQPISKLSYSMYIWHLIVITINASLIKTNTYFSDYDVILSFWSNFGITLFVSVCVYLAVEAPVADIESYLLPRNMPKADKRPTLPAATTVSQQNLCE
ncbi:nose resistant to fluoxetine protein 6-like [Anastrepha obliqua]|uniref:nose resistant to fluoxetine protein 6-like n=1 Tax=Anastrepha obliqua TaxID=95512 RepID=UPI00240999D7|nr:nose resistant to fluoxetine protein 6-like [Anastrepha obliqua]